MPVLTLLPAGAAEASLTRPSTDGEPVGSPQPQNAHCSQPTLSCAAADTTLLSTLVSFVAPNSVSSSASPVLPLTFSALPKTASLNGGHAKFSWLAMLSNGQ